MATSKKEQSNYALYLVALAIAVVHCMSEADDIFSVVANLTQRGITCVLE